MNKFKQIGTIILCAAILACNKNQNPSEPPSGNEDFSYGDSVFFVRKDQPSANLIKPKVSAAGTYSAFPEGLSIDASTGSIDLEKSEPGLRYEISFKPSTSGAEKKTAIIISGINYLDNLHYLSENDSIVTPVYNADPSKSLPAGEFDLGSNKIAIDPKTGKINVRQSIRNGLFNDDPQNDDWRKISIDYKVNDASGGTKSRIEMIIYYYETVNDIPSNVSSVMRAHQGLVFGINKANIPVTNAPPDERINNIVSLARPRPPCVIIVGR